ncbi:MAG: NAD-dependent epimerase/dehydratase family protein [Rhodospirillales bacterium]
MIKVGVLGAGGFVGRHLVASLSRKGAEVLPIRLAGKLIEPFAAGLAEHLAPLADAQVVINLAAALKPRTAVDTYANQDLPADALRHLKSANPDLRFIHVSSVNVLFSDLTDPYSRQKRAGEDRLSETGIDCTVIRPGLIWSWNGEGNSALFATYFAKPLPIHPMVRPGNRYRPVVVETFADWLGDRALESWTEPAALTVLGDRTVTLWDLAQAYARIQGRRLLPLPLSGPARLFAPLLTRSSIGQQFLAMDRANVPADVELPFRDTSQPPTP